MQRRVVILYYIKNKSGEYFTGNKFHDKWDANIKNAENYLSIDDIVESVKKDAADQEGNGNDWNDYSLEDGTYTIEIKMIISGDN